MKAYPSCVQVLHPPYIGSGESFSTNITTSRFNITSNITGKKIQDISSITCFQPYYHLDLKVLRSSRGDNFSCIPNNAEHLGEFGDSDQTALESRGNYNSNSEDEEAELFGPRDVYSDSDSNSESELIRNEDGVKIHITKIGKRSRKIESSIQINANLSTVWGVLTDYERLADFLPGLAFSRLLEKRDNYVRLFQIGQQNLALGIKFNAKAVLDCYEMELEKLSVGQRRAIKFKMVEGDFEIFEGKWSIEQYDTCEEVSGQEFKTVLSYVVEVEPKLWLPVRLVQGRLCKEIISNLSCLRNEAHIRSQLTY